MVRCFLAVFLVSAVLAACASPATRDTDAAGGANGPAGPAAWQALPAYRTSAYCFDDTVVRRVEIRIAERTFENVVLDSYMESRGDGAYALASTVTIDGETLSNVGLRTRGGTSRNNWKRQFKLAFDCKRAYTDRSPEAAVALPGNGKRRFHGVRKLNLRASQNDPTILREKVAAYVFERAGCPAPRVGFARVYINGTYWGLYLLTEQIDESFLDARFGEHAGDLFKGGRRTFFLPGAEGRFELLSNKKGDGAAALGRFFNALAAADSARGIAAGIDPAGVLAYLAAAMLVGHWDSYLANGNNDYLYRTADGRYRILPFDMDNTLGSGFGWSFFDPLQAPVFDLPQSRNWAPLFGKILGHPAWKARYAALLATLLKETFNERHLWPRIDAWRRTIEAAVLEDPRKHGDWGADSVEAGNEFWRQGFTRTPEGWRGQGFGSFNGGLKGFISQRAAAVAAQL